MTLAGDLAKELARLERIEAAARDYLNHGITHWHTVDARHVTCASDDKVDAYNRLHDALYGDWS